MIKYFIDGDYKYLVSDVLSGKVHLDYPISYLRHIANSREWTGKLHVTDLFNGSRETYLKYVTAYGVDPDDMAFAVSGTMKHDSLENDIGSEISLEYKGIIGRSDLFEKQPDGSYWVIDYKTSGAYAVRKFMGWQKRQVPVLDEFGNQVYLKSGKNKGKPKMKSEWFLDPSTADREIYEYQLNIYRKAAEKMGLVVSNMKIFFILRDGGLAATRDQGLNRKTYYPDVNKLSDAQIDDYIHKRSIVADNIKQYFDNSKVTEEVTEDLKRFTPPLCSEKERWFENGVSKKCEFYCPVRNICRRI